MTLKRCHTSNILRYTKCCEVIVKAICVCCCSLILRQIVIAQDYGVQWVIGPNSSILDFRNDTLRLDSIDNYIPFLRTSACISDEQGNLLYTCYGYAVTDRYGATLLNGDSLSPCPYTFSHMNGFGLQQAALFIPKPGNNKYYYLIHFAGDTGNNTRPGTIYYSLIDKQGNFGLGEVIEKNRVFYEDVLFRGGGMTACKHANGRDWWIMMGGVNNNTYYSFLLTPMGISDTTIQQIGPTYNSPFDNSYSCFSEDGSKYATTAYIGYTTVFDFDRCSGTLSNPIMIHNNVSYTPDTQSLAGGGSVAFSPNGRFLYVATRLELNQYDLWSSNIQDSSNVYKADSTDFAQLNYVELAPNGKIYGCCWSGGFHFLHVVNRPNELGDSCDFVYAGQPTWSDNSINMPNMPNYRLGPLAGSGCDTLTGISPLNPPKGDFNSLRVFPNPADKAFYIEMPAQGNYVFELLNEAGQVVERRETKQVDIINVQGLPSGQYFLSVTDKSGRGLSTLPVIVQH